MISRRSSIVPGQLWPERLLVLLVPLRRRLHPQRVPGQHRRGQRPAAAVKAAALTSSSAPDSWNPAEDPPLPGPITDTPRSRSLVDLRAAAPTRRSPKTGVVIWFSPVKNQGFLKPDDGSPDVWVHGDGVRPGVALKKDDRVSYREEVYGRQARLKAVDVGKYRPAQRPRRPTASLRAPPPQFDAALERALAESADAYAHHQAPPTANDEDDELQRALKASADEFADEQRRRAAQAAPAPAPQYNAPPAPQYNAQPTPQYDPPYVPPTEPRRSLADLAGPPHNNGYAHVDDDLARALAASREAEEIDARRRRDLAAAEERLRAARLAAAPPPAAPPAPPGLPPGFGGGPPPGPPPGLAGFPAAPKLPRGPARGVPRRGRHGPLPRPLPRRGDPDPGGLPPADGPGPPRHRPPAARRRRAPPAHGGALPRERALAAFSWARGHYPPRTGRIPHPGA